MNLADLLGRRFRAVVLQEHADPQQDVHGPGAGREEPALRQRAVVAGRQDHVLPAQAAIGTGRTDVGHPVVPAIVDQAKKFRRHLHDHRPLGEFEDAEGVDRVCVGHQQHCLGIHQLGEEENLVILHSGIEKAPVYCMKVDALHGVHECVEGMGEVQVIIDLVECLLARHAVREFERADSGLDLVGRRDRGQGGERAQRFMVVPPYSVSCGLCSGMTRGFSVSSGAGPRCEPGRR